MCLGTLVTEGPRRSGALNTATRTLENGREVFALPGNVDSPGAQLPNMLISEGARLVTGAADILSALVIEPKDAPKAAQAAVAPMEAPAEKKPHIPGGLDETQRAICAALLAGDFARAQALAETVSDFHRLHQLNWIDDLCDAVLDVAETRFYRGVAKVTRGFVHMETDVIADELEVLQDLAGKQAA